MSSKVKTTKAEQEQAPEEAIQHVLGETESFFEKNWKMLTTILCVVVVVVGGWFLYDGLYVTKQSDKASSAMFTAQQLFAAQQYNEALNGNGSAVGFLDIIKQYSVTPEANIAKHYAGVCYLKLGDKTNALASLAEYKTTKGVPNAIINAQNFGLQADIMVDNGDMQAAVSLYKKAIDAADNVLTTPSYLKKLGLVYEKLGRKDDAIKAYQTIEDSYPASLEGRDIQKYIGAAQQLSE